MVFGNRCCAVVYMGRVDVLVCFVILILGVLCVYSLRIRVLRICIYVCVFGIVVLLVHFVVVHIKFFHNIHLSISI